MVLILRWFWLFLVAFGLLLGRASGGYVEPTSHGDGTLIPGYGQGKAVVKEVAEQGVKQGMKLGSAILDATRALPAPSGGVITDASKMLPWNGGGASSFVKAGDEWLSPSFTNSTEWFHDGWRGGEAARATVPTSRAIVPYYPANNGFLGATERQFLMPGQVIDRYGGSASSRFFSPAGTSEAARALPAGSAGQPLRSFEVLKPFEVDAGTVAPAFGQPGLGTQFRTPVQLDILLKRGILRETTP